MAAAPSRSLARSASVWNAFETWPCHHGPLCLAQFGCAAVGHGERMRLAGGRLAGRVHRAKGLPRLRPQARGAPRGPLGLHDEPLGSHRVGQPGVQRPAGGGLVPLAATLIAAWTGAGPGAQQGAEGARMVPWAPEGLATVGTLGMGRDKDYRLPFEPLLRERVADGWRFGHREAQRLDWQVRLRHHRHFLHRLCTTSRCTHDPWPLDVHGMFSSGAYRLRGAFSPGRLRHPQRFDALRLAPTLSRSRPKPLSSHG